jgi:hypothetical protein
MRRMNTIIYSALIEMHDIKFPPEIFRIIFKLEAILIQEFNFYA